MLLSKDLQKTKTSFSSSKKRDSLKSGNLVLCGLMKVHRKAGFSLIEVVVSLAVMLVIMPPMLSTMKIVINELFYNVEFKKGHTRITRTEALLKAPLFYCGFGMQADPSKYKESFGSQKHEPFRWEGPITVQKGPSGFENSELRVSFARPSSTRLDRMTQSETPEGILTLHKFPEQNEFGDTYSSNSPDIRNWVFFPTSFPPSTPFCIMGLNGKVMSVKNNMGRSFSISGGDRVHHMMAISLYSKDDFLYTKDFRFPGAQPRIKGVLDVRFDLDIEKKIVIVYILARGDRLYDAPQEIRGREEWPDEYIRQWVEKGSRYKLFASKTVWYLPNLIGSDLICEEYVNATEVF